MDNPGAMLVSLITVGVVNLLMFPILAALIKRGIMKKLDAMDEKREIARRQTEDEARQLTVQARNDENQARNEARFDTIFKAMQGTPSYGVLQ